MSPEQSQPSLGTVPLGILACMAPRHLWGGTDCLQVSGVHSLLVQQLLGSGLALSVSACEIYNETVGSGSRNRDAVVIRDHVFICAGVDEID